MTLPEAQVAELDFYAAQSHRFGEFVAESFSYFP